MSVKYVRFKDYELVHRDRSLYYRHISEKKWKYPYESVNQYKPIAVFVDHVHEALIVAMTNTLWVYDIAEGEVKFIKGSCADEKTYSMDNEGYYSWSALSHAWIDPETKEVRWKHYYEDGGLDELIHQFNMTNKTLGDVIPQLELDSDKPIVKGGNVTDEFTTGAHRDNQQGKPMYHLIPLDVLKTLQSGYGGCATDQALYNSDKPQFAELYNTSECDYTLIPKIALNHVARLYYVGAAKYGVNNWQKGINVSRVYASMLRHVIAFANEDTSEDHLAAVIWNASVIKWYEQQVRLNQLPNELLDFGASKHVQMLE